MRADAATQSLVNAVALARIAIQQGVGALQSNLSMESKMLPVAEKFGWSSECVGAILAASEGVPDDTRWPNLRWCAGENPVAWWHLESPVEVYDTPEMPESQRDIRAILVALIGHRESAEDPSPTRSLYVSTYTGLRGYYPALERYGMLPGATFFWSERHTVAEMVAETEELHRKSYEPGGMFASMPHDRSETFAASVRRTARLVAAGLAWIHQRIAVVSDDHSSRQMRKEERRVTGREPSRVLIVHLRRPQRPPHEETEGSPSGSTAIAGPWTVTGAIRSAERVASIAG